MKISSEAEVCAFDALLRRSWKKMSVRYVNLTFFITSINIEREKVPLLFNCNTELSGSFRAGKYC